MHSLPIFVRLTDRPVILIGDGEAAAAKRQLLERAGARIVGEESEAALAIVALADDGEARAAVERLRARGVLVNATDRPELCDFTLPAILDRDPVLVAIGTGGASAGLAKALRQRAERLLPAGLGAIAARLKQLRPAIFERWPDAAERRHAVDDAFDEGGPLDPLLPREPDAVDRWLAESRQGRSRGDQLEIVTLRSRDPHDLTIGETLLLGRADRVYIAPGVPDAIVHRARADAERIAAEAPPEHPSPGLSVFIAAPPE